MVRGLDAQTAVDTARSFVAVDGSDLVPGAAALPVEVPDVLDVLRQVSLEEAAGF